MSNAKFNFTFNLKGYVRKPTRPVGVGHITIGGVHPIRVQTMTNTDTNNISLSIEQIERVQTAGAELVRLTTQGLKEVDSLKVIKDEMAKSEVKIPLIADIHFNPRVALAASAVAHKIRINPGNYSHKSRASTQILSEKEYEEELKSAEEQFIHLLDICKQNGTAIRIGVNHGSLSKRIMDRYGDTPKGMAIAAMEFAKICHRHNFHQVVISMKSSNTRVMVHATRLLVSMMQAEGLNYPIHLGVTEAGEGEDGRIKSAVGIGTLLMDGVGDTIRVSLTEDPENEIPVALTLANLYQGMEELPHPFIPSQITLNPFEYSRKSTNSICGVGGNNVPMVIAKLPKLTANLLAQWGWSYNPNTQKWKQEENRADFILVETPGTTELPHVEQLPLIGSASNFKYQLVDLSEANSHTLSENYFLKIDADTFNNKSSDLIQNHPQAVLLLQGSNTNSIYNLRNILLHLQAQNIKNPCVLSLPFKSKSVEEFQIVSSAILGPLFLDGLADGILLETAENIPYKTVRETAFGILQASRVRITKTEFIACPGCGRTLFSLNSTLQEVKQQLAHLKGLKIAVMGCIVNGPGEMADADYGYVGSGPRKVTLYYEKEVVKKNIPQENAVEELIAIIKENGDWVEPS